MAASSGKKSSGGNRSSAGKKLPATRSSGTAKKRRDPEQAVKDSAMFHEIELYVLFVAMVFLFCCNFGIIGAVGNAISGFMFGIFGFTAYVAPILCFLALMFWFANKGAPTAIRKMIAAFVLFLMTGVICDLLAKDATLLPKYDFKTIYQFCSTQKKGGGILGGSLAYFMHHNLGIVGTILVVALLVIIFGIILTERSLMDLARNMKDSIYEKTSDVRESAEYRREIEQKRREEKELLRSERDEERRQRAMEREDARRLKAEEKENEKILRMEKKVSGVSTDTALKATENNASAKRNDVHEIIYNEDDLDGQNEEYEKPQGTARKSTLRTPDQREVHEIRQQTFEDLPEPNISGRRKSSAAVPNEAPATASAAVSAVDDEMAAMRARMEKQAERDRIARTADQGKEHYKTGPGDVPPSRDAEQIRVHKEGQGSGANVGAAGYENPSPVRKAGNDAADSSATASREAKSAERKIPKTYMFPPLSRLQKGAASTNDNSAELKETALRLRDTLHTFGVNVTITDISQGPSVTRYELQPEQGVKVSKIVNLADDIKLNLAATDIRIEAPIPGKAAIGIEVPNKENMMVALRDLLESKQFQEFDSKLAFAVGKDIAGQTVVADIAKMPHMLIAGSTGSGKSVCINTLIMSILYKAHPDDVKLIMVDPKVVELSVYNGIPHLLCPVVTDPKKASAALKWAVTEMDDRYKKFAEYNVRDLKGYNKKLESERDAGVEGVPDKLPQIVIIVDELADLMMVAPGEVEESICRLAQLARACGIHLIIATQRPSVDVITGLIKANMPSRVAFAVTSNTDSRTILDMVGAEKLLGKGDMLFYPQGYSKPARIQGAFVSDKEVGDVVDFLKNQMIGNVYDEAVVNSLDRADSQSGGSGGAGSDSGLDEFFEKVGRYLVENCDQDKASSGMLQRVFKIGFNRAARIMDQLSEKGVVSKADGTKPRKVLMTVEEFDELMSRL